MLPYDTPLPILVLPVARCDHAVTMPFFYLGEGNRFLFLEGWWEEVMSKQFFEQPILNSSYEYPSHYWELDGTGQPTQRIIKGSQPRPVHYAYPQVQKQKGAAK